MNNEINLRKKFLNYLFPSVIAMWIYSIYTMVDGIFVGRGVGSTALASVNIAMPYVNFIFAISMLFSTGASTIISIYLGQKNYKKANEVFTINIIALIIVSIILSILSLVFIEDIAIMLGATESTINLVMDYLRIVIMFNGFFIVSYCLEVLVKADGFPYLAIIGMVISAFTNVILDSIFVLYLDYGIKGAAIATIISQGISCLFFFYHFLKKKGKLAFVKCKFSFKPLIRIISIGFPDAITELTSGIVILIFNQTILKVIGDSGVVSYSIICYISTLVLMTMIGITQGMQPLTSFYYGKSDKVSVKKLFNMALKTILIASIFTVIICILFAPNIVDVFIGNESVEIKQSSILAFRLYSLSYLLVGINIMISGFFASIEDPLKATIISLSRGFIFILAFLTLFVIILGGKGIWITPIFSEIVTLILSFMLFIKVRRSVF